MNDFLERIFDLIEEMAFSAKKIEDKITGHAEPIILHLTKILRYQDPLNYKKHIIDINKWIRHIRLDILRCSSKISYKKLYAWIFIDCIGNQEKYSLVCEILDYDYSELKKIRSDKEVYELLTRIMNLMVKLVYDKKFSNLEDILKELNIFDKEQYEYNKST